jgi:tRNA/tmRNA/rRNA uracil-C5-methylase (TrmA/RlmC/RlmD family)
VILLFVDLLNSVVIEDILESPEPFGYRNKGEFTFGPDSESRQSLGFRVSSYPIVRVDPPDNVPNIPHVMKRICRAFIDFLNTEGLPRLKVYDQLNHTGVYRILTIRYSRRTRGLLLMLCVSLKETGKMLASFGFLVIKRIVYFYTELSLFRSGSVASRARAAY